MKWVVLFFGLLLTAASSGCWRPYYGQTYAPPAYQQPQVYQQAPAYQQPPVYQPAPIVQQQGCAPVVCPPVCTPCY